MQLQNKVTNKVPKMPRTKQALEEYFEIRQPYVTPKEEFCVDQKVLDKVYKLKKYIEDMLLDIAKREGEFNIYSSQLKSLEDKQKELVEVKFDLENEKVLVKALSKISQTQLSKIENLCTVALQDILQDTNIKFKISMEETKKGIDTYFYTVSDAGESDILQSEAGGVKNVLSVCLRLIFLEFCKPKIQGPVILDEVGANISAEYQSAFGEFLRQFSEKNNRQIILITHNNSIKEKAPNLITIYKHGNESKVGGI